MYWMKDLFCVRASVLETEKKTYQNKTAMYANRCYVICKYRLFVFERVGQCMW